MPSGGERPGYGLVRATIYSCTNADHPQRPHRTIGFRDRDGDGVRMDIETDKSYVTHDRLLRMWLCVVQASDSQRNPRPANRSRSFHCDYDDNVTPCSRRTI